MRTFSTALLLVALAAVPVSAQTSALGPKDGSGLPATDLERVVAGRVAPDFTLERHGGGTVTLSEFRGTKEVILVFYRGHW